MDTLCCSTTCEKRTKCARHSMNNTGLYYVENFESYGSGYMTTNGYEIDHWCGKLGDYKMFEPIEEITIIHCRSTNEWARDYMHTKQLKT